MLQSITNDLLYILSLLESIGKIEKYTVKYNDPEFFFDADDQMPFNATLSLLVNIGEASGKTSEELRKKYKHIPWQTMKNFRNRIAHDYMNLDIFIVFSIIKNELPKVEKSLEELLIHELNCEVFMRDEYEACIGNRYYRHINFEKITEKLK